jgi:hypothetical protein
VENSAVLRLVERCGRAAGIRNKCKEGEGTPNSLEAATGAIQQAGGAGEQRAAPAIATWPNYMRMDSRKPASLAVALNWDIGSSSLNAEVKAFVRLQTVRGSNSGCAGLK